ncbi:MAG: bifunctional nuclease family protein [Prevotella sp.]|nr:bifunctional nuclease family protein [Prevotella sp.]
MKRTLLRFENIRQIVGTDELSVVLLTDLEQRRTLSVVCDHDMTKQMMMRLNGKREVCRTLLPEVLVKLLPSTYEMMIVGIYDGQYQVMLMDTQSGESQRIRISDAILLSLISKVPLYIEDRLMERQSVPFDEHASGVSIPINTMDTARLKLALKSAVEDENYELASQLRDEIKRRRE